VSRTTNNGNNQKLTELAIVDRAARRAGRWFWLKIAILILVVAFVLLAVRWLRHGEAGVCAIDRCGTRFAQQLKILLCPEVSAKTMFGDSQKGGSQMSTSRRMILKVIRVYFPAVFFNSQANL
jgi:hypothetical protein